MKHAVPVLSALAVVGAFSAVVVAQDIKPDRAIKYRQGIMQAQSWSMNILGAVAKGDRPYNKDEVLNRAITLEQVSHMAWEGYIPGSDQGAPTKAKPEVWKEPAKFKQMIEAFEASTAKLVAAAKVGTLDAVKGPIGDVGKTCTNCHDEFRSK
jgi:cytochrome c556